MAARFYTNTSKEATLLASVGTADTTFNLSGSGMVNIPALPFTIRIDPDTPSEEVCLVTAGSATSLTVTRGFDGTSTFSHLAGATVRHVVVAEFFNKADAHVEASTNVHGLTGGAAVVGDTQAQTLTNKTINASVVDIAHSTSPAATQAFRADADAATAKDGFVWDNSGSSTGKAFLAKVAGVEKTYVEGDGDLVVGGTTSTTGLTNTGTIANTGPLNNTGAFTNTGTANITGAVDLDSTLNVDGTTTLVGDLTMPLPAAGFTPRISAQSRNGGVNFEGKDQVGTITFDVDSYGTVQTTSGFYLYNTASPVVAVVSDTSVIASPTIGMIVFQSSDGTLRRFAGASPWTILGYYGSVAASGFARYFTNTVQSIPDIVVTPVQFHTAVTTSGDVTPSGAGNTAFTLNKSGVWSIHACVVFASGSGFRAVSIRNQTGPVRYAEQNMHATATSAALQVSCERSFTSGSIIEIAAFQASGGTLNTLPVEGMHAVSLRWVGP